ncbi:chymotrypsin-2-like isoform X2 [Lasioglossum baleicum]|uniref:chymotrypsin-2-like isoform X2 n=2 Tax=Lasioglossum baleicum TaxID=434251 RepID=UPI003FCE085B
MHVRAILLILGWTIGVHGTSLTPRIVGGGNAPGGVYPYQAMIAKRDIFLCGGSIISEHFILTAAHCVYKQNAIDYTVTVGTYYLSSSTNPGISYPAKELIWHPKYNKEQYHYDIGLIRLNDWILFINKRIELVPLASVYNITSNEIAIITGWGRLSTDGEVPSTLQEIKLKVLPQEQCAAIWGVGVTESHICTFTRVDEGVCNGDSGGALVVNGVQVGIVSYGMPCARGSPDVYTRVYSYIPWIREQLAGDHIFLSDPTNSAANIFSKTWMVISLATLTYLHFFA